MVLPAGFGFTRLRVDFKYDFMGRRVEKTVFDLEANTARPTRRYLYEGWNLLAELDGTGANLQRSYTWGLDLTGSLGRSGGVGAMLQMHDHTSSKTYWPTYDGNGNVVTLVNAGTGALAAVYEYDPFGNYLRAEVRDATVADNPWRFSTKYTDPETGLVYYGLRYYSPSLGRFINRDPIGERGGINVYGFAGNDAINGWDVLGLQLSVWRQLITQNPDSRGGGGGLDDEEVQQADPFKVFGDRIYGLSPEKDALDRAQLGSSTGAGIIIELRFIDPNDVVAPNSSEHPDCAALRAQLEGAMLTRAGYKEGGVLPAGWGLAQKTHNALSGFNVSVFVNESRSAVAVVYRGTESGLVDATLDWAANGTQVYGIGNGFSQYNSAISFARRMQDEYPGKQIVLYGHSQGGGEAAIASMATGLPARTYNPAGVSIFTALRAGVNPFNTRNIQGVAVRGEPLSMFTPNKQDGTITRLDPAGNSVGLKDRHSINSVILAIRAKMNDLGCK